MKKNATFNAVFIVMILSLIFNVYLTNKLDILEYELSHDDFQDNIIRLHNFYPGRIHKDYSDKVFDFDVYLNYIGATDVERYMYDTDEGRIMELHFTYNDSKYKVKSVIFKTEDQTFGIYSQLEADTGDVIYAIPSTNTGKIIADANSPLIMDQTVFDVLHVSTDKRPDVRQKLRSGMEDLGCPFYGFGVAHYEKWSDGKTIWHDDSGNATVNIHY